MKLMTKNLAVLALVLASTSAMAGWQTGVSYSNLSEHDISVGTATVNAGYQFSSSSTAFTIMPQIRFGTGVKDDSINGYEIDIERYLVVAARIDYPAMSDISFFIQPAYANLKFDGMDEWNFGLGFGATYSFNKGWGMELMYEDFDDTDVLSAGISYRY
tara:strand:- start:3770 stop:4246 length:477 start_codon:yes stop_codon:yes gene_type:complete